jgi:hypothetical protein
VVASEQYRHSDKVDNNEQIGAHRCRNPLAENALSQLRAHVDCKQHSADNDEANERMPD